MSDLAASFIGGRECNPYKLEGMMRIVFSLVLVLALLAAPLSMFGGGAVMAHGRTAEAASPGSHCPEHKQSDGEEQLPGMSLSCAIACATIVGDEPGISDPASIQRMPPIAITPAALHEYLPEGESPPPRIPPEI